MATRSPVRPRPVRHRAPRPAGASRGKKRFRWIRRLLALLILMGMLVLGTYLYILQVYAPRLRSEARVIPALVRAQLSAHHSRYVNTGAISPHLKHAIVAVEDRRFYYHPGIDPIGMVRAGWVNLHAQKVDQGGSTLEEQLVKRALLQDDRSIHEKLRRVALAWAIDQEFSKRQILELYLNAAYYGQGAYGPGAAARIYFGADVSRLTVAQAAFLAALPQAPSIYGANPTAGVIRNRQLTVLADMVTDQYITPTEGQAARSELLHFDIPTR